MHVSSMPTRVCACVCNADEARVGACVFNADEGGCMCLMPTRRGWVQVSAMPCCGRCTQHDTRPDTKHKT